jgi:hypothetical protein
MKYLMIIVMTMTLSGCQASAREVKSPCVAIEAIDGSSAPCARHPVNANWLS